MNVSEQITLNDRTSHQHTHTHTHAFSPVHLHRFDSNSAFIAFAGIKNWCILLKLRWWAYENSRNLSFSLYFLLMFYDLLHWLALFLWHEDRCCSLVCSPCFARLMQKHSHFPFSHLVQNRTLKIKLLFLFFLPFNK